MPDQIANPLAHPTVDELEFAAVLRALSDPIRLGIVVAIARHAEPVQCNHFDMPVGKTATSHHFRILREAGIILQVPVGTRRLNTLRRADLDHRFPGLLDLAITRGEPAHIPVLAA